MSTPNQQSPIPIHTSLPRLAFAALTMMALLHQPVGAAFASDYTASVAASANAVVQQAVAVPSITTLNPTSVGIGSAPFMLTVDGTNFVQGAVVRWNGTARPTTFKSATRLTASISAADVSGPTTGTIAVVNPGQATVSGKKQVTVVSSCNAYEANNTLATAKFIQPNQPQLHSFCAEGDVDWLKFTAQPDTRYQINTFALSVASKVNTVLSLHDAGGNVVVPETADASTDPTSSLTFQPTTAGTYYLKLRNRPGLAGPTFTYNIKLSSQVVPTITSLNPTSWELGHGDFTLTVGGENFSPNSVVRWKGIDRPTRYISPNLVYATITRADFPAAGPYSVVVYTPAPTNTKSNAVTFTVTPPTSVPAPQITQLSKTTVEQHRQGFDLLITGKNFVPRSVVRWNNQKRVTTFINSTYLRITLTSADLAQPGTIPVVVNTPAPGGGLSNIVNFTILPTQTACERDEPNDEFATAKRYDAGDRHEYAFCSDWDNDIISFDAVQNGSDYFIGANNSSPTIDLVMRVIDPNGQVLREVNEQGPGQPEGMTLTIDGVMAEGRYYVIFSEFEGRSSDDENDFYVPYVTQ